MAISQSQRSLFFIASIFIADGLANHILEDKWYFAGYVYALVILSIVGGASCVPQIRDSPGNWEACSVAGSMAIATIIAVINVRSMSNHSISFLSDLFPYAALFAFGAGTLIRLRAKAVIAVNIYMLVAIGVSYFFLLGGPSDVPIFAKEDVKLAVVLLIVMTIAGVTAFLLERAERRFWILGYNRYTDLVSLYPGSFVEDIYREGEYRDPVEYDGVIVLFADIVSSTQRMTQGSATEWYRYFNELLAQWDEAVRKANGCRIKANGDGIVVIGGIPEAPAGVVEMLRLALTLREILHSLPLHEDRLQIRVGLNIGPASTGFTGKEAKQFDVFGESMAKAARLMTKADKDKILILSSLAVGRHEFQYGLTRQYKLKGFEGETCSARELIAVQPPSAA